jgi:hypothetical protein
VEPWLGIGASFDCTGMRMFDIAINNKTMISKLDIFKEAGTNRALKKTIKARVEGGQLVISFPQIAAGQAIIAAIAIASVKPILPNNNSYFLLQNVKMNQAYRLIKGKETVSNKWQANGFKQTKEQNYQLASWLNTGLAQYTDDAVRFTKLPSLLYGAEWISFPKNIPLNIADSTTAIGDCVFNEDVDVYIAIHQMEKMPNWLKQFQLTQTKITTTANSQNEFEVYQKKYLKGQQLILGSNSFGTMYSVIVKPASFIQPAFDLKPIINYKAANGHYNEGFVKGQVNEKEALMARSINASVAMNVQTGVGDIYSLTFKYANTTGKKQLLQMQFIAADGTVLHAEKLLLTTSLPGKWNYLTTDTGTMINAGNYTIIIQAADAIGIAFSGVDMQ